MMNMRRPAFLFLLGLAASLCPLAAETNVLPGYNGRFYEGYILSPLAVYDIPVEQLGFMRNEVFAKYGRAFQTPKYRDYFSKKSWYRVNFDYKDSFLSAADVANVNLILSFERPSLDKNALQHTLLRNIEYSDDNYTVVFSSATRLLLRDESDFYARDGDAVYSWSIRGDWVLATRAGGGDYGARVLLLLDHSKRTITRMEIVN